MLENIIDLITYLKAIKNQYDQFKTQTGTDLTYDKYYELLISSEINHDKNSNGTLILVINYGGMSMRFNRFLIIMMRFNLT